MISKKSIQMTRWSDVLFVALLFGGATGLAVMETNRAATYDSEYAAYCQTQEAAYQAKEQETEKQMAEAEAQFTQQKAEATAKSKAEIVKHQQAGKAQLLDIQKRLKATVSMLDMLKKRYGKVFKLDEALPAGDGFLTAVAINNKTVKLTYKDPGEAAEVVKVRLFSKHGLITGEVEYTIEAARGFFGGTRLQAINTQELPYEAFHGAAQYYAVEVVNKGGAK